MINYSKPVWRKAAVLLAERDLGRSVRQQCGQVQLDAAGVDTRSHERSVVGHHRKFCSRGLLLIDGRGLLDPGEGRCPVGSDGLVLGVERRLWVGCPGAHR